MIKNSKAQIRKQKPKWHVLRVRLKGSSFHPLCHIYNTVTFIVIILKGLPSSPLFISLIALLFSYWLKKILVLQNQPEFSSGKKKINWHIHFDKIPKNNKIITWSWVASVYFGQICIFQFYFICLYSTYFTFQVNCMTLQKLTQSSLCFSVVNPFNLNTSKTKIYYLSNCLLAIWQNHLWNYLLPIW